MPLLTILRTRLDNLVTHPRPASEGREDAQTDGWNPGDVAPQDSGRTPAVAGDGEGIRVDHRQLRGVTPEDLEELVRIRDLHDFIDQSYRRILDRPPDFRGAVRYARCLRLLPFYSRRRFLQRLLRSEEYWRLQARRLGELNRALDQERLALTGLQQGLEGQRQALQQQEQQLQQHLREQAARIEGLLRWTLEPLRPLAGQHSRLLEQLHQHLEQQSRLLEQLHQHLEQQSRLLERQHQQLERQHQQLEQLHQQLERQHQQLEQRHQHLELQHQHLEQRHQQLEQQDQHLEQKHQHLEQQHQHLELQHQHLEQQHQHLELQQAAHAQQAICLERLGQLPAQHGRLLEQHQVVLEQGAAEQHRWVARAADWQRSFFGELQRAWTDELRRAWTDELQRAWTDELRRAWTDELRRAWTDELRRAWADEEQRAATVPLAAAAPEAVVEDARVEEVDHFVEDAYRLILRRPPAAAERAEGSQRLCAAVGRIKGEFLQALLGQTPGAPAGADDPPAPSGRALALPLARQEGCRICGGDLTYKWSLKVLQNRFVARYHECNHCRALQVVDPSWLEEAYAGEDRPREENPDAGRFSRNFSAYNYFVALHTAGLVAEHPVVLDYGGGYGLLAQMLKGGGYDVWQADPYVPVPFLAADRSVRDLDEFPDGSFDLIFALEVLEHLVEPLEVLARLGRLLKPSGTLMLSTGIYQAGAHDSHWTYLATEGGQHVTFWSRAALAVAAERFGFRSIGYFPGDDGFCILMSRQSAEALKAPLTEALVLLQDADHLRRITAPWDFQAQGHVRVVADPTVEAIDAAEASPQAGRGAA